MNINMNRVGVIGSGTMGSQIAMVCAIAGYDVVLNDIEKGSLQRARASLMGHMNRWIEKERLTKQQVTDAFNRIEFSTFLHDLKEVDIVIEAIVERLDLKKELFSKLDPLLPAHTILATNSSTIVSSKIAEVTSRPDKVCNIHFFNPVLVMELVEIVQGPHTSEQTAETASQFVKSINKLPILLKKEISGFIANRILGKLMDEALFLYENGYATHEEIDLVVKKALGHPIGPFALMDLTGIDVNYDVRQQRYAESGNVADRPAKIVEEKVKKGELGRKTGKGFYSYA